MSGKIKVSDKISEIKVCETKEDWTRNTGLGIIIITDQFAAGGSGSGAGVVLAGSGGPTTVSSRYEDRWDGNGLVRFDQSEP